MNLRTLDLSGCKEVTGTGLAHLLNLKKLNLAFRRKATDATLAHLPGTIEHSEKGQKPSGFDAESVEETSWKRRLYPPLGALKDVRPAKDELLRFMPKSALFQSVL